MANNANDAKRLIFLKQSIKLMRQELRELRGETRNSDANRALKQMSKSEIIEIAMSMPEMPTGLMELIEHEGFQTGSRVYGGAHGDSDYDWCVPLPPQVFEGYALGHDQNYWVEDRFCTVYANHKGLLLNIICFSDWHLFMAWSHATIALKELNAVKEFNHAIKNSKWARVRLFRAFREVLTPLKMRKEPLSLEKAIEYRICKRCDGEAINFTCKPARDQWLATGVCERCREEMER